MRAYTGEVGYVSLQAVAGKSLQSTERSSVGGGQWSRGAGDEPVFCACESDCSPLLTVTCPGSPSAPQLRVDNMDERGVDVAWEMPDETADDQISVCHYVFEDFWTF